MGKLSVTGRDVEEHELAMQFDKNTCQWTSGGDAQRFDLAKERQEIIEYLELAGQAGPKEVAQALSKKEDNIKNLMSKMHRQNQIAKDERGKYRVLSVDDYFGDLSSEDEPMENFELDV
jgi:hypothetical protein